MNKNFKNLLYGIGIFIAVIVVIIVFKTNKTCVVTYDTGGGTIYPSQNIKCGTKAEQPVDPELPGFKFIQWIDSSTNEKYDFNKYVEKDITIKAQYERQ